ncbi:MAG: SBBP repeat-containing protein [Candidatus Sulfotelmatobacter sp.]
MGNGRALSGESSGSRLVLVRALAAACVLLAAACLLLGSNSRRYSQNAAQVSASPNQTASGSLFSPSSLSRSFFRSSDTKPDAHSILAKLPLIFEANQGQADPSVKFLARGAGYTLLLDETGAKLELQTVSAARTEKSVHMTLVGGNPASILDGTGALPGKTNYLLGNDPHKWHTGVAQFAGVHYKSVYPGIDLVFYGNQGRLEYDFQVAPGADPAQAELQFDGAAKLELTDGDLILAGNEGEGRVRLRKPRIYQNAGDHQQPVDSRFVLRASNRVGFEVGSYDRSRELVIDPLLEFSTYFGGSGSETAPAVAVNGDGFIYIAGTTQGSPETSFPVATAQTLIPVGLSLTSSSPSHIFVAKIDPTGPSVVYETFLGGTGTDTLCPVYPGYTFPFPCSGLGVDISGKVYIVGNTTSIDFPTNGVPYQTAPKAKGSQCSGITCTSIFVSVLNTQGSQLGYSSYLSGTGNDQASGMTIDTNADVFITGTTTSNDAGAISPTPDNFPATYLPVPYQTSPRAATQFFVTKVNTNNVGTASIAYSTYFGGATPASPVVVGGGVAVDTIGNIYFSGTTNFFNSGESQAGSGGGQVTDFPIVNAYQPCLDTPPPTIITFPLQCTAPTTTPYPFDAFVAKINPNNAQTGSAQLLFSTYLGGGPSNGLTAGAGITIDSANVYLTGTTNSSDFILPTGSGAFQPCLNTPPVTPPVPCTSTGGPTTATDAYVARFSLPASSTTGTAGSVGLGYFSYLGGTGSDAGLAIAVDTASGALVAGWTQSTDFPVTLPNNPIQSTLNGLQNAFFAHVQTTTLGGQNTQASFATYFGGNGTDRGTGIAVDSSLNTYMVGDTTSSSLLQMDKPVQSLLNGPSDAFVVKLGTAADLCITCVAPVLPANLVAAGNPVTITFTVTNQGPDLASNIIVSGTGAPFTSATVGSGTCSTPSNNSIACTIPALQAGSPALVTFTVTPTQAGLYAPIVSVSSVTNNDPNPTNNTETFPFTATIFSVSVLPNGQTVSAGNTAPYTVQITANPVFASSISLGCSSAPVGATCNFGSNSINLTSTNSASTSLNVTTTARPVNGAGLKINRGWFYAFWMMVPGIALIGGGAGGKRRRKWLLGGSAVLLLFALVLLQPACSSGKTPTTVSGTPAGNYSMTLTATSGSFTQSASFNLTVQ